MLAWDIINEPEHLFDDGAGADQTQVLPFVNDTSRPRQYRTVQYQRTGKYRDVQLHSMLDSIVCRQSSVTHPALDHLQGFCSCYRWLWLQAPYERKNPKTAEMKGTKRL